MEELLRKAYKSRKILVTGDTGFKGSWLSQWLLLLDAEVYGVGLEPSTSPALYTQLRLEKHVDHRTLDINDYQALEKCIQDIRPDLIFHLAAQSLVRESYKTPLETMQVNVMGTAHVLEAVRSLKLPIAVVAITSDKCYENKEWLFGYREGDPLGGYDPYSASKGAAELVISSWRRSFFNPEHISSHGVRVASARAGNVIGGGDWAVDRIVPDAVRFLQQGEVIQVRNPHATRPWQHVLEPLGGYLLLGSKLLLAGDHCASYCEGFNFGPYVSSNKPVSVLADEIVKNWGSGSWTYKQENAAHEASLLHLSADKAYHVLGWQPAWNFNQTVSRTVEWYKATNDDPSQVLPLTQRQIDVYMNDFNLVPSLYH